MTVTVENTYRHHQLRKVAILVATLDGSLADQLLADLPPEDASAVRQLVDGLDEIDPAEFETAVADFQNQSSTKPETLSTNTDGVEIDASLLARIEANEDMQHDVDSKQVHDPWKSISESDSEELLKLLLAEQPQTIAAVLARLDASLSASIVSNLEPVLQADVLNRLANLDPADERAMQVIESQLSDWLDKSSQQKQRMAAGYELVTKIVSQTPHAQRQGLLDTLDRLNPNLAAGLKNPQRESLPAQDYFAAKVKHPSADRPSVTRIRTPGRREKDPLTELEALDDESLLRAMQSVDRRVVMLALAGASDTLMKRIVRGLPRKQAAQFRKQVRSIGPTKLSDMVAAQRELVRCSRG